MSKTPGEEFVKSVASELTTFLRNGEINPGVAENNLDFKGVDKIQDLETILRIHFVLSEDVVSFLKKLPQRVRRIRTESEREEIRRRGEIRGRINWGRTVVEQKSMSDDSIFVSHNSTKNYNVAENLVLKKLLSEIYYVLDDLLEKPIEKEYDWLSGLRGEKDLVNELKGIYERNVHIDRIKDPELYNVTDRHLSVAENSRKDLYKEASELLIKYREFMGGEYDYEELEELLKETLIVPGDTPTLFELYSLFKLIRKLENELEGNFTFKKIDEGSKEVAILENEEGDEKVLVYHDSTGSRSMSFFEGIDKLKGTRSDIPYLERYRKSVIEYANVAKYLVEKDKKSVYSGRPDILVEYRKDGELKKLIIGEVKYGDREYKFLEGLRELMEYVHFARERDQYLLKEGEESILEAVLIVDKTNYLEEDKLDECKVMKEKTPCKLEIFNTEDLKKYGE